jgi:hypothetical protein
VAIQFFIRLTLFFSGLPRDLWSLAVTGLGKRHQLQAAVLRGLQNCAAIRWHVFPSTRPCEPSQTAWQSSCAHLPPPVLARGGTRRGNPVFNEISVALSGLPRDLWSLAVTGLGKRPQLQAALLRGLQNCAAIQLCAFLSTRPCEARNAPWESRKNSKQRCFFLGRFTSFAMTGEGMTGVREDGDRMLGLRR